MSGKRETWQRVAVQQALDAAGGFVSAQALHTSLHKEGARIGLATVYRALADLVEEDAADQLQREGETVYRACTPGHHHHLICRSCGSTVEIEAKQIEAWAGEVAARHGFTEPSHVIDVFGVCPTCASGLSVT